MPDKFGLATDDEIDASNLSSAQKQVLKAKNVSIRSAPSNITDDAPSNIAEANLPAPSNITNTAPSNITNTAPSSLTSGGQSSSGAQPTPANAPGVTVNISAPGAVPSPQPIAQPTPIAAPGALDANGAVDLSKTAVTDLSKVQDLSKTPTPQESAAPMPAAPVSLGGAAREPASASAPSLTIDPITKLPTTVAGARAASGQAALDAGNAHLNEIGTQSTEAQKYAEQLTKQQTEIEKKKQDLAAADAKDAAENQKISEDKAKAEQDAATKIASAEKQYQDFKVDPSALFKRQSTFNSAMDILQAVLTTAISIGSRGLVKNTAWDDLKAKIDQDVQLQIREESKLKEHVGSERQKIIDQRQTFTDRTQQMSLLRKSRIDALNQQLELQKQGLTNQASINAIDSTQAHLSSLAEDEKKKIIDTAGNQVIAQAQAGAAAANAANTRAYQQGKDQREEGRKDLELAIKQGKSEAEITKIKADIAAADPVNKPETQVKGDSLVSIKNNITTIDKLSSGRKDPDELIKQPGVISALINSRTNGGWSDDLTPDQRKIAGIAREAALKLMVQTGGKTDDDFKQNLNIVLSAGVKGLRDRLSQQQAGLELDPKVVDRADKIQARTTEIRAQAPVASVLPNGVSFPLVMRKEKTGETVRVTSAAGYQVAKAKGFE